MDFFLKGGGVLTHLVIALIAAVIALIGIHSASTSYATPPLQPPAAIVSATTSSKSAARSQSSSATSKIKLIAPKPSSPVAKITSPSPAPPPTKPDIAADILNTNARAAVVNILCTTQTGGAFEPITGSGTIIDPRGVILTNAHVAQFFLLRDYPFPDNITCIIRTGSPAKSSYTAKLLYIPPQWVADNASQITTTIPKGTGQNDYAFLLITGTTNNTPLPASFPYVSPTYANAKRGDQMLLASYPAGFLEGINIQNNLYLTTTYASVKELYVFDASHQWIDLFSIPGTIASQGGSSGGAAINRSDGSLAGIIVTDTNATTTAGRDLRAISFEHIEHSLISEGFSGLPDLLSGNLEEKSNYFTIHTAPLLTQKLIGALDTP